MKILHAVHDFLPAVSAGVEVYVFNLAREQAKKHEVAVFHASFAAGAPDYEVRRGTHGGIPTVEIVNNRLYRNFEETWRNPRIETAFAGVLREFHPDAVHFHHLMNLSAGCVRQARDAGARAVFTLHDFSAICPAGGQLFDGEGKICPGPGPARCPRCHASSGQHLGPAERIVASARSTALASAARKIRKRFPGGVATLARAAKRAVSAIRPPATWAEISERNDAMLAALSMCHVVISPSRFLGRSVQAFGMKRDFIHSDYGFVPPNRPRSTTGGPRPRVDSASLQPPLQVSASPRISDPEPRASRLTPRTSLRAGFVGTISRHKGVEVLVKAAEIANGGIEVHIHGSETVDTALAARLKARHASPHASNPAPRAFFHGPFPPDALDEVFRGMDVLVVPSVWPENSPLVIHEAFMRGVPVVASHIGGIPEIVHDGVSGFLFTPGDTEGLSHLLRRISGGRGILDRLRKGLPRVKTIAGNATELERLYRV